jgi:hypothetical protein
VHSDFPNALYKTIIYWCVLMIHECTTNWGLQANNTIFNDSESFTVAYFTAISTHPEAKLCRGLSSGMKRPGRGVDHSHFLGLRLRVSTSIPLPSSCSCMTWYGKTLTFTVNDGGCLVVMIRRLMNDDLVGIWKEAVVHDRSLLMLWLSAS